MFRSIHLPAGISKPDLWRDWLLCYKTNQLLFYENSKKSEFIPTCWMLAWSITFLKWTLGEWGCGRVSRGSRICLVAQRILEWTPLRSLALWSWRRGQGWVGAALCFVTGGTLAGRLPHLGTPDFILNVLAQPVGASSSAVMAPAAPSLPGGCPNQTWAPSTSRKLWGRRALKAVWECGSLSTRAGRSAGTMSAYSSLPPLHSSSRKEPSAQETRHGSN